MDITKTKVTKAGLLLLGATIVVASVGFGVFSYSRLELENRSLVASLASTTQALQATQGERETLLQRLSDASSTLGSLAGQLGDITSTVGTLQKLTSTDPELLKKYSKVFFLSENYVPKGLTDIAPEYLSDPARKLDFLTQAYPFLTQMIDAGSAQGVSLRVASAFRSFAVQSGLKSSYKVTYGSGANAFSADQGYSEHQLGTAVDLTTPKIGGALTGFDKTAEYKWLQAHAWEYGFVLSYPAGNTYYIFEPWHWRFVGIALAQRLHEEHESFYSLDQRQIDPYLVRLFDTQAEVNPN